MLGQVNGEASKRMDSQRIRDSFFSYFEGVGHRKVPSSSLIPSGDATLLFTNAGMVPFKDAFLGSESPPAQRCVSIQRCVRAGGKHNDLDRVGFTRRHHTFFEMMGNFSFGDYFKKDAIAFAWEFLTQRVGLSPDVLWVTVYTEDDEAEALWKSVAGVHPSRIVRLGEKDNFWQMGNTGPCGPCSEILVDQGPSFSCGRPTCAVGCDCDRYLEIWNLVFMQYERNEAGRLSPLPHPSIDTGMGLERLSSVLQGVESNYETDLFMPIIDAIERLSKRPYGKGKGEKDFAYRVIADHIRASTFLIWEGLVPSNEGRGYVLRRFIRRAVQFGRDLTLPHPFLPSLGDRFVELMKGPYPELSGGIDRVKSVLAEEEDRFNRTLEYGLPLVQEALTESRKTGAASLSGDAIFLLYDTHGIPVDVIEDWVRPEGFSLDLAGFERRMEEQKEQGRRSWIGQKSTFPIPAAQLAGPVHFVGYEQLESTAPVLFLVQNEEPVEEISEGSVAEVVTQETPFYPEGGGQVGDRGTLTWPSGVFDVDSAYRPYPGWISHRGTIRSGRLSVGENVRLIVDRTFRRGARIHHTATHLLHAALRRVLGDHVRQAGSLVLPDRLRFDFTHGEPLSDAQIRSIESLVNEWIATGESVRVAEKSRQDALAGGALAFFGDKYGDRVRVVEVPGMSVELCGGTHVQDISEIGVFYVISESGIASGTRRIEAIAGSSSYAQGCLWREELSEIRRFLKVPGGRILDRLGAESQERESLERELRQTKSRLYDAEMDSMLVDGIQAGEARILFTAVDCKDGQDLRLRMDRLKDRISSGMVILAGRTEGKVLLLGWASPDMEKRLPVNGWIRKMSAALGGKGGGRPAWAEGGGSPPSSWPEFLSSFRAEIRDEAQRVLVGS